MATQIKKTFNNIIKLLNKAQRSKSTTQVKLILDNDYNSYIEIVKGMSFHISQEVKGNTTYILIDVWNIFRDNQVRLQIKMERITSVWVTYEDKVYKSTEYYLVEGDKNAD